MITRRHFLSAATTTVTAASAAQSPRKSTPPNVVVIFADDLGYGDLSCYGGQIETPHLDRLATQGIRFTQAYTAAPICSPSRVGLHTGQHPSRHKIFSYLDSRAKQRQLGMRDFLDPTVQTIARTFQQAGYATAHYGKWHMGGGRDVDDAPHPKAYGFDDSLVSFEGLGNRVLPPGRLSDLSEKLGQGEIQRVPKHELTRIYADKTIEFLRTHSPNKPVYLHLFPNDVHDPFQPSADMLAKYQQRFAANKYHQQFAAVLEEFDRQLGRVLDAISQHAPNTITVFCSDNGPTAWPYYYKENLPPPGSTAGLRGRKWSLYEGGIRTPLIARWPGHIPVGRTDATSVISLLDLFPTLSSMAGVQPPPNSSFDGANRSTALLGRPQQKRPDLFWDYGRSPQGYPYPGLAEDRSPNLAMRSGRFKALVNDSGSQLELYDLEASPKEDQNLAAKDTKRATRMRDQLLAWRRSLP
jgi:arylsulfatase A-like enzyme